MNLLSEDNQLLLGPDGKPLTTAPVVKSGNLVFVDGNGTPIMVKPVLGPNGQPVLYEGKILMTQLLTSGSNEALLDSTGAPLMTVPLLDANGVPVKAGNGKIVYVPPILNSKGVVILEANGSPKLAQPLADNVGSISLTPDGRPFVGQPLVKDSGAEIKFKGANVFVGAVGMPVVSLSGNSVKSFEDQICNLVTTEQLPTKMERSY